MRLITKRVTPLVASANRANSTRSTGPLTEKGKRRVGRNAGKYFVFGQITPSRMRELGEDPAKVEKLRQSLRSAIGPRDGFEEMLVEEMAVNRWRLRSLHRAETGLLSVEQSRLEYLRVAPALNRTAGIDNLRIECFGIAGVSDSPEKYIQLVDVLQSLRLKVEKEGFVREGLDLLGTVYGKSPDVPGCGLITKYKMQLESAEPQTGAEDVEGRGCEQLSGDVQDEKPGLVTEESAVREAARKDFLESLDREILALMRRANLEMLARQAPMPEALKDSQLIPSDKDLDRILRYEAMLQREFERVQRQLLDWRNRKGRQVPGRRVGIRAAEVGILCPVYITYGFYILSTNKLLFSKESHYHSWNE